MLWLVAPALLAAAALGAFVLYASMTSSTPQASGGLPWGGIRLYAPLQVKSWVQGHGGSYARWQKRHPAALAIVAPRTVQRAQPDAAKAKHAPAAKLHRTK